MKAEQLLVNLGAGVVWGVLILCLLLAIGACASKSIRHTSFGPGLFLDPRGLPRPRPSLAPLMTGLNVESYTGEGARAYVAVKRRQESSGRV